VDREVQDILAVLLVLPPIMQVAEGVVFGAGLAAVEDSEVVVTVVTEHRRQLFTQEVQGQPTQVVVVVLVLLVTVIMVVVGLSLYCVPECRID
jgi:hypothetical protein